MKPNSLLTERDYDYILDSLLDHPSPDDFLNAYEADYLPINQSFYERLLEAIRRVRRIEMRDLIAFSNLPDNLEYRSGDKLKEARQMFSDPRLEACKNLLEKRAQVLIQKNDWRPEFKKRVLVFLESEALRHVKKDADKFSGELQLEKEVRSKIEFKKFVSAEREKLLGGSEWKWLKVLKLEFGNLEGFINAKSHNLAMFLRVQPDDIFGMATQIEMSKNYTDFIAGLKVESRVKFLDSEAQKWEKGKTELPPLHIKDESKTVEASFIELFAGNTVEQKRANSEKALIAAKSIDPPLLNVNGKLLDNYTKVPALRALYEACFDAELLSSNFKILPALKGFGVEFTGKPVSRNAGQVQGDMKLKGKLLVKLYELVKGV